MSSDKRQSTTLREGGKEEKLVPDPGGKITLVPRGGLGQRLRTVASTIALARKYTRPLEIIWFQSDAFEAPSNRLFTLDPQMRRESITIREAKWTDYVSRCTPDRGNVWLSAPFLLLGYDDILTESKVRELLQQTPERIDEIFRRRHRRLFIQTGCELTHERDMYKPLLPNIEVINVRNSRLSSWHNNIVGIHIDRTTSEMSMQDSPTELFIRRMYEIVVGDPTTSFFVTTTSHDERERLQTLYSSRIVAPSSISDATSVDGLIETYGDLLALSQTVKILTTPNSAYTAVASSMGHVQSETLSIYNSPTIITK